MKPIKRREYSGRVGADAQPTQLDAMSARIDALGEELRERGAALEEANRELREVSRYRSMMLEHMVHELRTPLTSILGFAELMLEYEDINARTRGYCEKVQKSGELLKTKIKQLVDLSRLEAGMTELFLHEFPIKETLREACAAVERLAHKRVVSLECETSPGCGAVVSDEGKLRQIFYAFLANAVARSPEGARVSLRAEPAGGSRVAVEITDEGVTPRDAASLFEPKREAESARCTEMTSLGLVIAQRLIKLLGGEVSTRARDPRGLAVRLELPVQPTEN
ncbi:MAG: HAMP domain-containing histidine kinase [Acidobacteria bacterium]|nr:HAMP domain-containing histidine kinase [Acidobacteriota bacterium]